jgi:hypothetical protein
MVQMQLNIENGKRAPASLGKPDVGELLKRCVPVVKSLLEPAAQVCDNKTCLI